MSPEGVYSSEIKGKRARFIKGKYFIFN